MKSKNKEPKDLGVRIGSKKQALFERVMKGAQLKLDEAKDNVLVQEEVISMCKIIIAKEKISFRKGKV